MIARLWNFYNYLHKLIIIIIIIIIFKNSAALSKIRRAAGTCHSVLTRNALSGVEGRWLWTVSTDAVQLVI